MVRHILIPIALMLVLGLSTVAAILFRRNEPWGVGMTVSTIAILLVSMGRSEEVTWLGRVLFLAGISWVTIVSAPASLRTRIATLFDRMTAKPTGRDAIAFAVVGVFGPAVTLNLSTTYTPFSGDTIPVVATVSRMVTHGDRDLSRYANEPRVGWWKSFDGQNPPYNLRPSPTRHGLYSAYPAGMEVFAWPGVLVARAEGHDLTQDSTHCMVEYQTAGVASAIGLALFFLTALHLGDSRGAFAVTVALAVGSVFFTTFGQVLWQQTGIAVWSLLVLYVEVRSGGKPGRLGAVVQGIACGLMLACRPSAATFLVPFGLWVLARDWRRGLLVPAVAVIAYAPFAALYWELYQNVVGPAAAQASGFVRPTLGNLLGVLFSPARGLFVYQPILVLLPLTAFAGLRSAQVPSGWYPFVVAFAVLHVALVSSWAIWWGGHSIGSRLVSELVPALGLVIVPVVSRLIRWPVGRLAVAGLVFAGFIVHHHAAYHQAFLWNGEPVDVDHHPDRVWDVDPLPFLYRGD